MPVVLVVLEAFPYREITQEQTPTLWRLASEGGRSVDGGVAELPAVSYTNHASFVTGRTGVDHGVVCDVVPLDGQWVPAADVGPEVATIFDACRSERVRSAAVVGDSNLIGVCGAEAASTFWPPVTKPSATASDRSVLDRLNRIDLGPSDFLFVQFNELDEVRHRGGALGPEVRQQIRATDAALAQVLDYLEPYWNETILFVVGNHDQEDVDRPPIDLRPFLSEEVMVADQGTAAMVVGPVGPADLLAIRGVAGFRSLDADHHVVWGAEGQVFGRGPQRYRSHHGSPRTATQLAVVGGGSAKVASFAARLEQQRPPATVWATWMAEALGLRWRPEVSEPAFD